MNLILIMSISMMFDMVDICDMVNVAKHDNADVIKMVCISTLSIILNLFLSLHFYYHVLSNVTNASVTSNVINTMSGVTWPFEYVFTV